MKIGQSRSLRQALTAHVASAVESVPSTEGLRSNSGQATRSRAENARRPRRLTSDQLLEIRLLELGALYGTRPEREAAFADLVGIHVDHLLRFVFRIALLWGLLDPIKSANAAVLDTALEGFELLDTYEIPRRQNPGAFFKWQCSSLFERLRRIRDQQVISVLDGIGIARVIRVLCQGPILPNRQKFEPTELTSLIELADTPESANLLEARFQRSQTGILWKDVLDVLDWSENGD